MSQAELRHVPDRLSPMMQTRVRTAVIAFGAILLATCGDPDAAADTPTFTTVVDTLGDTIVVRITGDIPAVNELKLSEVWRVGDPDGDETTGFGFVHSMGVNSVSEVYVFEGSTPQLRHYDASGALIRVIGGKGSGPGEYQRANGVTVLTDGRVALWDAGSSRINIYSADGEYLDQWRPPVTGFMTSSQSLTTLTDGRMAASALLREASHIHDPLGRAAWFVYDAAGTLRDTLLQPIFGDPSANLPSRRAGDGNSMPVPFLPRSTTVLHPQGFVVGSPAAPYVVFLQQPGALRRIERVTTPWTVPDAERAQRRQQVVYYMRRNDPGWTWNGPEIPQYKPPLNGIMTTLDGALLVSVSTPSELFEPDPPAVAAGEVPPPVLTFRSRRTFEWFDADGTLRGRFTLPLSARLLAMRGRDAWGTVNDSLDIPYLVRWRIEPSRTVP